MTKVNLKTNASYNFVAPEIDDDANKKVEVNFPTAEVVTAEPADGAIEVTVKRQTVIIGFEEKLDADLAFTMLKAASVGVGASVIVIFTGGDGADRTVTFTGDVRYPDLTVKQDQPTVINLVFDGENFLPASLSASSGGADGADGASAYEIWLAAGNVGSEAEFLTSLKGADGADGAPGADGADGADGAPISGEVIQNIGLTGPMTITLTKVITKVDLALTSDATISIKADGIPEGALVLFNIEKNGHTPTFTDLITADIFETGVQKILYYSTNNGGELS